MIKDKITRQLKIKFKDMIEKTRIDGKEHGFIIYEKDGRLFPYEEFEGTEEGVKITKVNFPFFVQGTFHTHPLLFSGRNALKKIGYKIWDENNVRNIMEKGISEVINVKLYSIESPSYIDLLLATLSKHVGRSGGTVCTSTDFKNNIVECWTAKDLTKRKFMLAFDEAEKLKIENKKEGDIPKKWILPLFDREIIDLNKDLNK